MITAKKEARNCYAEQINLANNSMYNILLPELKPTGVLRAVQRPLRSRQPINSEGKPLQTKNIAKEAGTLTSFMIIDVQIIEKRAGKIENVLVDTDGRVFCQSAEKMPEHGRAGALYPDQMWGQNALTGRADFDMMLQTGRDRR
jgi:hypothetical protein